MGDDNHPSVSLLPLAACLLPRSARDDVPLCRPVPQTLEDLAYLAQAAGGGGGGGGGADGRPAAGLPRGAAAADPPRECAQTCAVLSVPPLLDSPSPRSHGGPASEGVRERRGGGAPPADTESANVTLSVCPPSVSVATSHTAEHGPWCTPDASTLPGSPGEPSRPAPALPSSRDVTLPQDFTGAFAVSRPLSELSLTDFCNLSDHRPLVVTFEVRGALRGAGQ